MFNCKVEFNNTSTNISFPCQNNALYSALEEMKVPNELKPKIDIHISEIDYEPLKCLEGKSYEPDAVNLLAMKLDSLTENEIRKFEAVRELKAITDIYDMLNLTDNMHYYTLVTDTSDLKAVGKLHKMTRDYGMAADAEKNIDFEAIGRELIESGSGIITKYGTIYTNSDLEYYEYCTRESLLPFQFYANQPVCVEMIYKDKSNYVYLPETMMAFERAAYRMGASDLSECEYIVEYADFNFKQPDTPNSVEMEYVELCNILADVCKNEGPDKLNLVVQSLMKLDEVQIMHIVPIIEYAGDSSSKAISNLCACIDSFVVYGGVSNAYELAVAAIDYEKYGEELDKKWHGEYMEGNIYVGIKDDVTLEQILTLDKPTEEHGIQMSGL